MLIVPIPQADGLALLIVLEDDNIERIKKHDNAEIQWHEVAARYPQHARPTTIAVAYASPDEVAAIHRLVARGESSEALKLLTGGFEFRPDLGDHDAGPQSLKDEKKH